MRILVVNWQDRTNPQAGGAEVHLHEIFSRLAARGHEVHLLCSGWRGAPANDVVDGMRVHRASTRYGFALRGRAAFRRLAAEIKPDIAVEDVNKVPLNIPGIWRGPFALLVPHLFGSTAFRELPAPLAAVVWAAERPMPRVYAGAAVHAISASTKDDLLARGFRDERVRVIYPGVDTVQFAPQPGIARESAPTFLYVGRLKRYKQVDVAIGALATLAARGHRSARLWIAGAGDDRPRLERAARELGIAGNVEFLGFVSEDRKLELYRRAWAVVLPSLKEGWGITNLEAAGCGTPALAADNSALRESVRDGETGFLTPTGDVSALASAMHRVAEDAALRERLGRGARAFAQSFSWERTAQETEAHLNAACAELSGGQES
ncbi:MAG TPA: glycosyltransferase family 4 protein [Gemmatimonadales bacterium]